MSPTQTLALTGIAGAALIAGLVIGVKQGHPVVGFIIGLVGGSIAASAAGVAMGALS